MSNQFLKLRRSAVPGRIPTTSSLDFGEIALNTYDGLAFMKKSGSSGEQIVTLGTGNSGSFTGSFSGSFTGSLLGTASWAQNAVTSSYILNAVSASFAATASYIQASGVVGLNLSQISLGSVTASVNTGTNIFNIVSGSNTLVVVDGTGSVGIGTTSPAYKLDVNGTARVNGQFDVTGSTTAVSAVARGANYTPTLIAAANGDTLSALDINPTFTNGAFTGVNNYSIRTRGLTTKQYFQSPTTNAGDHTIAFGFGGTGEQVKLIASAAGSSGQGNLYIASATGDSAVATTANANVLFGTNANTFYKSFTLSQTLLTTGNGLVLAGNQQNVITNGIYFNFTETRVAILSKPHGGSGYADFRIAIVPVGGANNPPQESDTKFMITKDTTNVLVNTTTDDGFKFNVSGSTKLNGNTQITGSVIATTGFTGSLFGTASWANNAVTASYILNAVSASFAATASIATSASFATTSSYIVNAVSASFASTASSADNFTVRGTLTAQTIVAQTITSSTDFITGSTRFGSLLSNTHQFTGSVNITGSLSVSGSLDAFNLKTKNADVIIGSSYGYGAIYGSTIDGLVQVTTDSSKTQMWFRPPASPSGYNSAYWSRIEHEYGNLKIIGSNYGSLELCTNAGFSNSGKIIFTGTVGTGVESLKISGPENAGRIALTTYQSSPITLNGGNILIGLTVDEGFKLNVSGSTRLNGNTQITGSLIVTQGITGSLFGTSSWANNATTASYILNAVSASFSSTASYWSGSILNATSASFASTASYVLNAVSASFAATASYVPASGVIGLNLSQISTGSVTASVNTGTNIFNIISGSNTLVVVNNAGSVGIGTTSPAYKLDVNGTARVTGNLYFGSSNSYLFGDTNNIRIYDKNNSIILQAFPAGVNDNELYIQSGVGKIYINGSNAGVTILDGAVGSSQTETFIIKRGYFANVAATTKNVLKVQTQYYSNITNGTILRGVFVDIDDTTTYTGFADVRAFESLKGGGYFNTTNVATSAILQADSTTKGFLPPRMTAAQRTAISSPAQGLLVFDTGSVTEGLWFYGSGSIPGWQEVLTNTGSQSILGGLTATSFTGSLFGTSSWANNAVSASFANTSSLPLRGLITASVAGATITFTKGDSTTFDLTVAQSGTVSTASYVTSSGVYGPFGANSILTASYATTASYASNGGVTQIVAGTNVTISPTSGTGSVTINATGGGGSAFPFTGSALITGSLVVTGSTTSTLGFTGSLFGTASWANNAVSASFAATASSVNVLNQNVQISGSLSISGSTGSTIFSSNVDTLLLTGSALITGSVIITGSLSVSGSITGSLFGTSSWAQNAVTSSYILQAVSASFASTASSADNFTVRGTLTAQTIVAQTITSSTEFITGSTIFGSLSTNTHQFTGSVSISGLFRQQTNAGNNYIDLVANANGTNPYITALKAGSLEYKIEFGASLGASYIVGTGVLIGDAAGTAVNTKVRGLYATNFIESAGGTLYLASTTDNFLSFTQAGISSRGIIGYATGTNYLQIRTNSASDFSTGTLSTAFFNNGNVGINTTTDDGFKFNVSGSTKLNGNTQITGSLSVTQGITGSLFGTSSWANNATTASYILQAVSASFATTASYALNGGVTQIVAGTNVTISPTSGTGSVIINAAAGAAFPFTGSALITGSLTVTGSISTTSTLNIGNSQFNNTSSVTTAGTTIVSQLATGSFTSAFYNYTIASASNARSGQVMSVWNGATVRYTEVTTTDIGNTATASFAVVLSGANVQLNFTAPGSWTVKNISNLL